MPTVLNYTQRRIFLTTEAAGGVWQCSLDLARFYRGQGLDVVLAILGTPPSAAQREEARLVPGLAVLETRLPLDWLCRTRDEVADNADKLATFAARTGCDLAHLGSPAYAAAAWNMPVVATLQSCAGTWWRAVRGDEAMPDDVQWRIEAIAEGLRAADVAVAPSLAFARMAQKIYPDIDFRVVHNGRDQAVAGRAATIRMGIITSGRLWDEGKNVRVIDLAAATLRMPVFAAGPVDGPTGVAQLFPHLHHLGELPNAKLRTRLATAAIYVSTALYEPFGLGVLEAAQSGCALVLPDIATSRELWEDCAIFVDPHDADLLAHTLRDLAGEPGLRDRLGAAARTRAGRYTSARMAIRTLSVYDEASGSDGHRGAA